MRYVVHLAALIGLGAFGVAFGDFASNPNLLGALGLMVLFAAMMLALATLYRPGGWGSSRPAPAGPRPAPKPKLKPEPVSEPEPALWSGSEERAKPRRPAPSRPAPMADAGWDAREAESARERRREERQARKRKP